VSTVERLAASRELQAPAEAVKQRSGGGGGHWRDSLDAAAALAVAQLATLALFAAISALAHSQKVSKTSF